MTTNDQIRAELYTALESLGAESDLLSIVGSWGDTLPDEDVLAMLKDWNAGRDEPAIPLKPMDEARAAELRELLHSGFLTVAEAYRNYP